MSISSKLLSFKKKFETPFETLNHIFISRDAILSNFDLFKRLHPNWSIFPVLKSNAYGHGIKEVATILKKRNLDYIVVDSFFEALKIREVNDSEILLIGYTLPENLKNMDFSFVTLVVYDFDTLEALGRLKSTVKIHLKVDTGMHRQGIYLENLKEFLDFIKVHKNIILEGVCTHFSDADSIRDDYSNMQEREFKKAVDLIRIEGFKLKYIHSNNSAAGAKGLGRTFSNAMRLGISLYGVNPLEPKDKGFDKLDTLKLALTFESTLILKKSLKKGEKVSYNGIFEAPFDMEIGIVPVGYYEGLSRKLSNNFCYYFGENKLNILGRICMNLTVIDVTGVQIEAGDNLMVISDSLDKENNIYELADKSETITYECFTRLSETIRRTII